MKSLFLFPYSKIKHVSYFIRITFFLCLHNSALMVHDEPYRVFSLRRYTLFKLWPVALNTIYVSISMLLFLVFPVTLCVIIGVYNYLLTVSFAFLDSFIVKSNTFNHFLLTFGRSMNTPLGPHPFFYYSIFSIIETPPYRIPLTSQVYLSHERASYSCPLFLSISNLSWFSHFSSYRISQISIIATSTTIF